MPLRIRKLSILSPYDIGLCPIAFSADQLWQPSMHYLLSVYIAMHMHLNRSICM